jgi:hypothetical protein
VLRAVWLVPVAALLAACGGASSYARRADAVCGERAKAIAALSAPRSPAEQAAAYDRLLRVERLEVASLRALAPPRGHEADAAALVRALATVADAADRLRVASLSGDSEGAQGALFLGRRAAREAAAHARALGLRVCGR